MYVLELDLKNYLSTTEYNPSPHRFDTNETPVSERQKMPLLYVCKKCRHEISFTLENFEEHAKSQFSNLNATDNGIIDEHLRTNNIKNLSFIDFYCPTCKQATSIIFDSGPSGYWGMFFFKIKKILIIDQELKV